MTSKEFWLGDKVEVRGYGRGTEASEWNGRGVVSGLGSRNIVSVTFDRKERTHGGFDSKYVFHDPDYEMEGVTYEI